LTIAGAWSRAASVCVDGAVGGNEGSGSLSSDMDDGVTIYLQWFSRHSEQLMVVILSAAQNLSISHLPISLQVAPARRIMPRGRKSIASARHSQFT
jgi:hypothetical protein